MTLAVIGVLFIGGIFSLVAWNTKNQSPLVIPVVSKPDTVTVYMLPPAPPPPAVSLPPGASVSYTAAKQIINDQQQTLMPDQEAIGSSFIHTMEGLVPGLPGASLPANGPANNGVAPTKPIEEEPVSFNKVEHYAEFPGGLDAFARFLERHLQVPGDLQAGEKVTVLARFKVNEAGRISDISIITSGGKLFDREVIRVLNRMPLWVPAVQNGHKVAIYLMQPVTFIGSQ
jgi:periplasmic protein TonB